METAEQIVEALLDADPKDFAMRASAGLSPDTMIKFQCPFTTVGEREQAHPEYFSDTIGDWQHDWERADAFRLGDYIHDGVLDVNDMPFGTESVIVVNPDGSPGQEHSLHDLDMGTAKVIDTYVSPEQDNEEHRDANPGDYFPRAARGR